MTPTPTSHPLELALPDVDAVDSCGAAPSSEAQDGYLSGLIVGIATARLSPYIADRITAEIGALIADAYHTDPETILSRVDDDAQAIIEAAVRDMADERRAS